MKDTQMNDNRKFAINLEYLFSFTARLKRPAEIIGPLPEGIRCNYYVEGGEVEGPKIRGIIRPVGGDWMTVRTDGVGCLDVRFTIETHDGALIYATHSGTMDLGEDGYEKFLRRELPSTIPLQVVGNYRTAHPVYKWINRVQCMGVGSAFVQEGQVQYDYYAIR